MTLDTQSSASRQHYIDTGRYLPRCSCAHNIDGSVTTFLCPLHADDDPCATMSRVTGRRRRGSVVRGTCTACGWSR